MRSRSDRRRHRLRIVFTDGVSLGLWLEVRGCTDPDRLDDNPRANAEDASCGFLVISGLTRIDQEAVKAQGHTEDTRDQTGSAFVRLSCANFEVGRPENEAWRQTHEGWHSLFITQAPPPGVSKPGEGAHAVKDRGQVRWKK